MATRTTRKGGRRVRNKRTNKRTNKRYLKGGDDFGFGIASDEIAEIVAEKKEKEKQAIKEKEKQAIQENYIKRIYNYELPYSDKEYEKFRDEYIFTNANELMKKAIEDKNEEMIKYLLDTERYDYTKILEMVEGKNLPEIEKYIFKELDYLFNNSKGRDRSDIERKDQFGKYYDYLNNEYKKKRGYEE